MNTNYLCCFCRKDDYEFLLMDDKQTKIHAGIYYKVNCSVSPHFGFSFDGIPYKGKHHI